MKKAGKVFLGIGLVALLAAAGWFFFKFYFVFGSGVKAGQMNFFVYKGYVFKTYEGRLILPGYNSNNSHATIQSNEFNFSVKDKGVARQLERCAGKHVELHYKEYLGAVPWRGMSKYVVDSVLSVETVTEPLPVPVSVGTE
ncbi:MAG: hypothetical protein J5831_05165 [Bacteroidales bacterium]|nr:hypothetical protein [Bacteroidales bacterium]